LAGASVACRVGPGWVVGGPAGPGEAAAGRSGAGVVARRSGAGVEAAAGTGAGRAGAGRARVVRSGSGHGSTMMKGVRCDSDNENTGWGMGWGVAAGGREEAAEECGVWKAQRGWRAGGALGKRVAKPKATQTWSNKRIVDGTHACGRPREHVQAWCVEPVHPNPQHRARGDRHKLAGLPSGRGARGGCGNSVGGARQPYPDAPADADPARPPSWPRLSDLDGTRPERACARARARNATV